MDNTKKTSNQDYNRNPKGKGGFGDNPHHRNNGSWKKEDTARGIIEAMIKLSDEELMEIKDDKDGARFKRTVAEILLDSSQDTKERWKQLKEMVSEVYGTPKQSVDVTTDGESLTGIKVTLVEANDKSRK
jgi:hypothetical protein